MSKMASSTCVVTTEEKQLIERNRLKTVVKRGRNSSQNGSQNGSKRKNMSQMV